MEIPPCRDGLCASEEPVLSLSKEGKGDVKTRA